MIENNLNGLTDAEVEKSKSQFGTNQLFRKKGKSLLSMFRDSFGDVWIKIICAALILKIVLSIISLFIPNMNSGNNVIEIISIAFAILLSTGFSTINDYKKSTRSEALQNEYSKTYAKVMRNGKLITLLTSDIVKNDVVLIQAGDKVPVDGLIIKGHIKVSQAAINGEFCDVDKHEARDMKNAESDDLDCKDKVFMGSVVTSGEAYMLATVIGDASELGKINMSLNQSDEEERLDTSSLKLKKVATAIGKIGVTAAAIAAVLQLVLTLVRADSSVINATYIALLVAESIMLMASIVIMAVPEGLPMMNSMVQAMNTESLYKKHILVKNKAAFADAAYMNLLFSDKTGTITEGKLALVEFILGDGKITDNPPSNDLINAIAINNLAKVSEGTTIGSNNMDRALLTYALAHGYDVNKTDFSKVKEISGFDSEKKCATAEMTDGSIYWKGATENIIDKITHRLDENGKEVEFSSYDKYELELAMDKQAKRTMKLLSVAKIVDDKVILYAVLCLRDNVRQDAIETVAMLNTGGTRVVMVTGDAEETAVAIAKEAGILVDDTIDIVLTHEQLAALSDDELKTKLPNLKVVSRAKPLDKKRLVSVAQSIGYVVGMTGDGVNDAPALKQADIGFAMGDGTAVAQEAGDIVILNNSLSAIKDCVLNSRTMAKSVGKFLIFQLTVNVSTILMNIIAPVLGWTEPFSIVQILWINLIMDTLAAMAFGNEPILERYMLEKPAKREDDILTPHIKTAIGTSAVFITLGSILILENIAGITSFVTPAGCADAETYKRTFMFAFFIYAIIFNSLNTRSEKFNLFEHIGENKNFIRVMLGVFIMQTLIIEFGGAVFGTTTLSLQALLVSIGLGAIIIPVDLIKKAIMQAVK